MTQRDIMSVSSIIRTNFTEIQHIVLDISILNYFQTQFVELMQQRSFELLTKKRNFETMSTNISALNEILLLPQIWA